jgi:hypothetical protein
MPLWGDDDATRVLNHAPADDTREQVKQLRRIGRRLLLRLQRDQRDGDEMLQIQLKALAEVTDAENQKTLERLHFLTKRLQLVGNVFAFVVACLGIAIILLALSGCSGAEFSAVDGSSAGAPSSAPAGGAMESDEMSSAGAGDRGGSQNAGGSSGAGGSSSSAGSAATDAGAGGEAPSSAPCDRQGWRASAWAELVDSYGGPAQLALDGDDRTRWTGGAPQAAGQWFAVAFGRELELERVTVRAVQVPSDTPLQLVLELDGQPTPARVSRPFDGELQLELELPRRASSVRLVLVAERPSWWSIDELTADCR